MGGWKVPDSAPRKLDYHDLALNFFRSYLVQMAERNKPDEQIEAFVRDPSPEAFGLQPDPNRDKFFDIIKHHSSLEERKQILLELEAAGKI